MAKSALEKAREAPGSTKGRILAAAEEVFAARGFQGASTREIAARAGVNISSLHYHWESKETLYFAVFRNVYDQIVDLLRNALAPLLAQRGKRARVIELTMRKLSADEARRYIEADQPRGSVGSYLFEKRGVALFDEVRGSDDSAIVGLPLVALCRLLREAGVRVF